MTEMPPKETPPRENRSALELLQHQLQEHQQERLAEQRREQRQERLPEQKQEQPQEQAPGPKHEQKKSKLNWKTLLTVAVAVVILWQLAHVFTGGHGKSTAGAPKSSAPSSIPKSTPAPTVTLGGHRVAAGGGPLVILNPGLVSPGGHVEVIGSGFAPKTGVTVYLKTGKSAKVVARGHTSGSGMVTTGFAFPAGGTAAKATVVAQAGGRQASASLVTPGGMATAKIYGKAAGKPGDHVTVNASGFTPGEKVNAYWGRVNGTPAATLTAGSAGTLSMASVPVGIAPVGPTTLVLVGTKSHATATAPYQMLGLYPSVTMHPWAAKAGSPVTFTGSGFAPSEPILIYLDASGGTPALTATASSNGTFSVGFVIPFGLKGTQRLTAVGSQSRTSVTSGLDILPYMPSAQASTYDALPGTALTFYGKGFAPNEVVLVYANGGPGRGGSLVSAFRVSSKGSAADVGHYVVPSGTGPGLGFTLVGKKSGGTAHAKVSVGAAPQGVTVPPQKPYVLPPSLGGKPTSPPTSKGKPSAGTHSGSASPHP
ncbi:MAG TPA: hypothetical protein VN695_07655 [Streptosporangiaceae bacterium]|nr:hypothetical protein [Streptosporangiaceae bacterium]